LNKSFKEQSEDRIKLTVFLDLVKVPLSKVDIDNTPVGKVDWANIDENFCFIKLYEKNVAKQYYYCG